MSRPWAIVLGGTPAHAAAIDELRRRGYATLLLDWLEDPPARAHADAHERVSAFDRAAVRRAAQRVNAVAIVNTSLHPAVRVAADVAAELGLPHALTPAMAAATTDKRAMKAVFDRAGLDTPPGTAIAVGARAHALPERWIAKAFDASGGLGMTVGRGAADFARAQRRQVEGWWVEEFIAGRELTAMVFVAEGTAHVVHVREKLTFQERDDWGVVSVGTIGPARMSADGEVQLAAVAQRIADAFGLRDAPFILQGIDTRSGGFKVLEINPRLGGELGGIRSIALATGVDVIAAAIDCALGLTPTLSRAAVPPMVIAKPIVYGVGGVLRRIDGVERALAEGAAEEVHAIRSPGAGLGATPTARNKVANVVVTAPDRATALARVRRALHLIDVVGEGGASLRCEPLLTPWFEAESGSA